VKLLKYVIHTYGFCYVLDGTTIVLRLSVIQVSLSFSLKANLIRLSFSMQQTYLESFILDDIWYGFTLTFRFISNDFSLF